MLNSFFPDYMVEAISADVVCETFQGTYIGWFDRSKANRKDTAPAIEAQPVWKIKFIETTKDSEGNSLVRTLYPNGVKEYQHVWDERTSLTYKYAN